jgi:hypothetical protein
MRRALTVTGRLTTKRRDCGSHVVIALLGAVLQGDGGFTGSALLSWADAFRAVLPLACCFAVVARPSTVKAGRRGLPRLRRLVIEGSRRTLRVAACFIRIACSTIVFELVVEARPMHPLKGLIVR